MQIGDFHLTRLREMVATEGPELFPELEARHLSDLRLVSAPFYNPEEGLFLSSIHLWVIRAEGRVFLLDAGAGAGKDRPLSPRFHRLPGSAEALLAPAAIKPEEVTDVVITHCHVDHIGWCTVETPEGPVPAFPAARYHIPVAELQAADPANAPPGKDPRAHNPWNDSIAPVLAAGLVRPVRPGDRIGPLEAMEAGGHSPGQLVYLLRDGEGGGAIFAADILHQPVQILFPELRSRYCADPVRAEGSRRAILRLAAEEGLRLLPSHFDTDRGVAIRALPGGGFDFTLG